MSAEQSSSDRGTTRETTASRRAEPKFKRRALFAGVFGAATIGAGLALRKGTLETENAIYHIKCEMHNLGEKPEQIAFSDALFVEGIFDGEIFRSAASGDAEAIESLRDARCKDWVESSASEVPVYNIDTAMGIRRGPMLSAFTAVETIAGVGVLAKVIQNGWRSPPRTRRRVMKDLALKATGIHLLTPLMSGLASYLIYKPSIGQKAQAIAGRSLSIPLEATVMAHPEIYHYTIGTRNLIMAAKAEAVAARLKQQLGRKPIVTIVVGALHGGIEADLKTDATKRTQALKDRLGDSFEAEDMAFSVSRKAGVNQYSVIEGLLTGPAESIRETAVPNSRALAKREDR